MNTTDERGVIAADSGKVDIEGLMERIRERVKARQESMAAAGALPAPAPVVPVPGNGRGDAVAQPDFNRAVAQALTLLVEQWQDCRSTLDLVEHWLRAETEHVAQREQELGARIDHLSQSIERLEEGLAALTRRTDLLTGERGDHIGQPPHRGGRKAAAPSNAPGLEVAQPAPPSVRENGRMRDVELLTAQLQVLIDRLTPRLDELENGAAAATRGIVKVSQ